MAFAINELQNYSISTWYEDCGTDYVAVARELVASCSESSRLSVVVYGLPNKDCDAGYSTRGNIETTADYTAFLNTLTSTIGNTTCPPSTVSRQPTAARDARKRVDARRTPSPTKTPMAERRATSKAARRTSERLLVPSRVSSAKSISTS